MFRITIFSALLVAVMASFSQATILTNVLGDPQFNTGGAPWLSDEVGTYVQFWSDASQNFGAAHDDGSGTDGFLKIGDNAIVVPNYGLALSELHAAAPGEIWEGQAWARDEHGTAREPTDLVGLRITFYNAGLGVVLEDTTYLTPTDTWTQFAPLALTAPAGTTYVRLQLAYDPADTDANSTGYVLFDTASLGIQSPVPEPASLTLALAGLGLVAVARGRKLLRRP